MLADSRPFGWRAAVVALAALYYLLPWTAMGPVAGWLGPPVAFLLVVFFPGATVARLARVRPRDLLEELAWYSLLGLFAAMVACFVWALWGTSAGIIRYGYPAVAALLAWTAPARDDHRLPLDRFGPGKNHRRRVAMVTLLSFVALVGVIVWVSGPPTHFTADTIDHTGYVNEVARTGDPFPTTAIYRNPGADGSDLRKSLLHALMGVWVLHLGISPLALFAFLAGAAVVILTLVVYTASQRLFDNRGVAIAAAMVFALAYDGGFGGGIARTLFYPNQFGLAPLLLFIAAAMSTLERPTRPALALCAIMGFTAAAVHLQYTVFVALSAGIIVLWKTCSPCTDWRTHLRRSLAAAIAAGLAILPYFVYRVVTGFQTNDLHKEIQGAMFVGGDLFVSDPGIVWSWLGWLGVASLVAVVPLWRYRRDVPGIGYSIAALLSVLLIVLNPLLMPVVFDALTYLAHRLGRIVPMYMVAGFLLAAAIGIERRYPSPRRWRAWRRVAVALAFVTTVAGAFTLVRNYRGLFSSPAHDTDVSHTRWLDDLTAVTAGLPDDAVIASDPVTSYLVSAFTPYYVLCTLDQHAPPNDRIADMRMAQARDLLSPFTSLNEKARIAAAAGVTHVLINHDVPPGLVLNYWTLDPDVAWHVDPMYRNHDPAFALVAESGPMALFARTGEIPPGGNPQPPVVHVVRRDAHPVNEPAGAATLVAARIGAESASGGDDINLDLFWTRDGPARPGNYVVAIRFDFQGLELPLGGRPFPKLARKLKETLDGVYYRFRDDHIIAGGFYGPDRWRDGAVIHDPTTVRIPRGVATGTYVVRAKLMRVPPMPNTNLHSYLFDDDIYSGVKIGTIHIGPL